MNATAHILGAAMWREYNPGLWTALALFLPVGALALLAVNRQPQVYWLHHTVGLGLAIAIHAAIIIFTKARLSRLRAKS